MIYLKPNTSICLQAHTAEAMMSMEVDTISLLEMLGEARMIDEEKTTEELANWILNNELRTDFQTSQNCSVSSELLNTRTFENVSKENGIIRDVLADDGTDTSLTHTLEFQNLYSLIDSSHDSQQLGYDSKLEYVTLPNELPDLLNLVCDAQLLSASGANNLAPDLQVNQCRSNEISKMHPISMISDESSMQEELQFPELDLNYLRNGMDFSPEMGINLVTGGSNALIGSSDLISTKKDLYSELNSMSTSSTSIPIFESEPMPTKYLLSLDDLDQIDMNLGLIGTSPLKKWQASDNSETMLESSDFELSESIPLYTAPQTPSTADSASNVESVTIDDFLNYEEKQHIDVSSQESDPSFKYGCDECDMAFKSTSDKNVHKRKQHPKVKRIPCDFKGCKRMFSAKCNMTKHCNSVHKKLKPHKCSTCSSSFSEQNKLKKHVASVHLVLRPFHCTHEEKCESSFGQKSDMVRHVDIMHKGIKRFRCCTCNKYFGRKSSLGQHLLRIHRMSRLAAEIEMSNAPLLLMESGYKALTVCPPEGKRRKIRK